MNKLNFFLVTYDRLYDKVIENLNETEISDIVCYNVQKSVLKKITPLVKNQINEWELEWNDFGYQKKQYYEYAAFIHLLKNPKLVENLTHIGISHYDTIMEKNSIKNLYKDLEKNPNIIFYQRIRDTYDLYLSKYEVDCLSNFMSEKLEMNIDPNNIWNNGWISEALSLTPKSVFMKFAEFLLNNKSEIENILLQNKWGIMNHINHRICGVVERMWGFYLVSCGLTLKKMDIIHDWDSYVHKHTTEPNWIK